MAEHRKREFWERLVAEADGDSIASTACRHRVAPATLKWWRWHLGKTAPKRAAARLKAPTLLPVVFNPRELEAPRVDAVAIELGAGVTVRVPIGADPQYVAALVAAMRSTC
jgi:hypothetical protein